MAHHTGQWSRKAPRNRNGERSNPESTVVPFLPDAEKRKRADFVVDTSHGLDPVRSRIRDILDQDD